MPLVGDFCTNFFFVSHITSISILLLFLFLPPLNAPSLPPSLPLPLPHAHTQRIKGSDLRRNFTIFFSFISLIRISNKLDPSIASRVKEDVSLPKATMLKIIKEMLPSHVRIAKDAQELLVECCVEFINLISSESNEICSKQDKRIIAPEHVLKALEDLGFKSYMEEVQLALNEHKRESMDTGRASGKWGSDYKMMSEEEAVAEQKRMFAEARERMKSGNLSLPKHEED